MNTEQNKNVRNDLVTVRVSTEEKDRIDTFARDVERRPVSSMVRLILEDYMDGRLVRVPEQSEISHPTFQSIR